MRVLIATIMWIGGLLLSGSDGPYMPWANAVGLLVFIVASIVLSATLSRKVRETGWQ